MLASRRADSRRMLERKIIDREAAASRAGRSGLRRLLASVVIATAAHYMLPRDQGEPPPPRARDKIGPAAVDDHSRSAAASSEAPALSWTDVLLRVVRKMSAHRIMALAAGMTYYSLLAIFPAIAALVAVYGLFADPSTIARHSDQLAGFLPGGALDVAQDQLTRVASNGAQTLGLTFLIGLGISLWSANAAMKSLFDTLNVVYGEEEKRGFVKLNAISLGFTIGGVLFVLAALGCIVMIPVILGFVGMSSFGDRLLSAGRWPAMYLVLSVALAVIYRYGPSREATRWRWISWGSATAAMVWLAASTLFSWYAASFGQFNETYGSLGAVVGFMTWLWMSAIVILLGAEIDAALEHQAAAVTTASPQPLDLGEARSADTISPTQVG
ncbi:YihY/virulence factor BrkB family protein [Rhodopseudomonas palustris]|nr:YihY/virulence factor BrkB family protein [Rhodopseudomonas palustris]